MKRLDAEQLRALLDKTKGSDLDCELPTTEESSDKPLESKPWESKPKKAQIE